MIGEFVLMTGRSNVLLAKQIGKLLKKKVHEPVSIFSDGEVRVRIVPNLRRRHVFIIQPTSFPVNDHLMELILMIDAARRASSSEIVAVIPYFGYSRQDRKEMPRVPISSSVVARCLEAVGVDRIMTVDIHSEQQQGFIKGAWDNLYGSYALIPALKKKHLKGIIVGSPDKGGVARATGYAKLLRADGIAIVYKERDVAINNSSETLEMVGEVKGRNVILVDDIIDTAGTITGASDFLKRRGAKQVIAAVTHGLFNGTSLERIEKSGIDKVIVTDTTALRDEVRKHPKVEMVSIAPLLAEAIRRVQTGESISSLIL
ncbi:MAG: hypothetical protein A3B53_02050 [Candidatus Levybacteria bacterium RIFCSPLOWO2_01_FULL_42_15]|nr:MAG: hypothetical protein A3B53_02050 [Candidatus Levybacteria bacterium RIFCSPLOWO2_01_FULL_42_15]